MVVPGCYDTMPQWFPERDFDATLLFDGRNEVAAAFHNGRATVRVPDFRLWSPDAPNLHTVEIEGTGSRKRPIPNPEFRIQSSSAPASGFAQSRRVTARSG